MDGHNEVLRFGLVDLTEAEQRQIQGGAASNGGSSARNRASNYRGNLAYSSSRGYARRRGRVGYNASSGGRNPGSC